MPSFEDKMRRNFEEQKAAEERERKAAAALWEETEKRRGALYDKANTKFRQDPRYKAITNIVNDPGIREAVNYMFKIKSKGHKIDHSKDQAPVYKVPSLPDRKHFLKNASESEFNEEDFVTSYMKGTISFKAGYSYTSWTEIGDASYEGYGYEYDMAVQVDKQGSIIISDNYSKGSARGEAFRSGYYREGRLGSRELTWEGNALYEKLRWITVKDANEIVEHLLTGFSRDVRPADL